MSRDRRGSRTVAPVLGRRRVSRCCSKRVRSDRSPVGVSVASRGGPRRPRCLVPLQPCPLSLTEGAQPALRVQAAVRRARRRRRRRRRVRTRPGRSSVARPLTALPANSFSVHGFDFNFSFYLIILLNLYSGNLNAFQK